MNFYQSFKRYSIIITPDIRKKPSLLRITLNDNYINQWGFCLLFFLFVFFGGAHLKMSSFFCCCNFLKILMVSDKMIYKVVRIQ